MYANLMKEVDAMQAAWGPQWGMLECLDWIANNESEYPSEIRRELKQFLHDGFRMFFGKEISQ